MAQAHERAAEGRLLAEPGPRSTGTTPGSRAPRRGGDPGSSRREGGRDIVVFGGGRIAHSLIRHRLVDEYRLTVHPVALGEGISLMHGLPEPQRFELVSSTAYADGAVMQVLLPT